MGKITLKGSDAQCAFWEGGAKYRAFIGGVGSGKTFAGCAEILDADYAGKVGAVVAPTYRMMMDATLRTFLTICETARRQGATLLENLNKSEMVAELTNGTTVLFRSADKPDRLRGPNLAFFYLDEAAMMNRLAWDVMIGRLRERPGRGWLTTTPQGFNWVYDLFVEQQLADYAVVRCATYENPYLSDNFIQSLRDTYGEGVFARQEIEGEFVQPEGAIFQREWFVLMETAPEGLRWVRSWDLAASTKQTGDFTAGAKVALAEDGTLYIADMIHGKWEWPDARTVIIQTARMDGPGTQIGVEKIAFQLAAIQELYREPELVQFTLREIRPDKDKVSRAMPWQVRAQAGKVKLVRGPWVMRFLNEVAAFPEGSHDDQVDAVSGAVRMLGSSQFEMRWV